MQVLPALVTGGVERGTVDVACAIADAGWISVVVSAGGPMEYELVRHGVKHINLPVDVKTPWGIYFNIGSLVKVIEDFGVDIVHARSRAPAWSAYKAAEKTGTNFITTFHGTYNLGPFGIKRWYNSIMTRGRKVIAISDFIASHIVSNYGLENTDKIRIIPRGIDIDRFDPQHVSPERMIQLAKLWRLPDGVPVIMLPGRVTRWKGQSVLIEAIAKLKHRPVRCLLVGSDKGKEDYRSELENLAAKLGLTDCVHVVGDCNDMPAAYMLTDVVVSASTDPEAFGRVMVEAQAMGRPIVASDHGGAKETVLEGQTGFLTQPGDAQALAQAIDQVLDMTGEERENQAAIAINHARSNFTKQAMCRATLDVYSELLNA